MRKISGWALQRKHARAHVFPTTPIVRARKRLRRKAPKRQLGPLWIAALRALGISACVCLVASCATTAESVALGVTGATVAGGRSVGSEIEQTYYVGVFDPQDQLPTQIYRLRVHGQGSFIGFTKFASGWVPAQLADSLGSSAIFNQDNANLQVTGAEPAQIDTLATGRRLEMFGPEGFREAPANSRLVLAMGMDPSAYFKGIDDALGKLAQANVQAADAKLSKQLFQSLVQLQSEDDELSSFEHDLDAEMPDSEKATP